MANKTESEKAHALYLIDPADDFSSRPQLIHADDVEEKLKAGWKRPEGMKANGTEWNAEDDLEQQDLAAEAAAARGEWQGKRDEKKAAELAENAKAAEDAKKEGEQKPDMKVQIVEAPKPPKGK